MVLEKTQEVGVLKERNARYYLAIAIAMIALSIYLPTLQNGFVEWDDRLYIFQNPHIRSFDSVFLKWAFFDFYASNWHPLTWMSHAVDYAFWGLNPMGHHLTSIMLHAANSFLAVLLIIKLLEALKQSAAKKTRLLEFLSDRTILTVGGVTGLLFGIHPVHVESVAWVSERKDLLCAFFFMLSIIIYTNYVRDLVHKTGQQYPSSIFLNKHYLVTALFFILALLSKPMAVTLPVVLLMLDWYPFQRIQSAKTLLPMLVEKIPFFAFSLASSVLTVLAQKAGAALVAFEKVSVSIRVFAAAKALLAYLWNMTWPLNLMPFYQHYRKGELFEILEYITPIALVIGITVTSMLVAKKQKVWATTWGYYVVTLVPVLGIVQVGGQLMADRYTYLPSLGPFVLMGLLVAVVTDTAISRKNNKILLRVVAATAGVFVLASLSFITLKQITFWKDTVSLWSRVIQKEPSTWQAYKERAEAFKKKGEFDKAIQDLSTAILLEPRDSNAYYNRGNLYAKTGQQVNARADFAKACGLGDEDGCKALRKAALTAPARRDEFLEFVPSRTEKGR